MYIPMLRYASSAAVKKRSRSRSLPRLPEKMRSAPIRGQACRLSSCASMMLADPDIRLQHVPEIVRHDIPLRRNPEMSLDRCISDTYSEQLGDRSKDTLASREVLYYLLRFAVSTKKKRSVEFVSAAIHHCHPALPPRHEHTRALHESWNDAAVELVVIVLPGAQAPV